MKLKAYATYQLLRCISQCCRFQILASDPPLDVHIRPFHQRWDRTQHCYCDIPVCRDHTGHIAQSSRLLHESSEPLQETWPLTARWLLSVPTWFGLAKNISHCQTVKNWKWTELDMSQLKQDSYIHSNTAAQSSVVVTHPSITSVKHCSTPWSDHSVSSGLFCKSLIIQSHTEYLLFCTCKLRMSRNDFLISVSKFSVQFCWNVRFYLTQFAE